MEVFKADEAGGGRSCCIGVKFPHRHFGHRQSKGGRDTPTVQMHKICQAKVHAVFTETELKSYYNTVDRLKEHDDIIKFIKWVSKKELEFFDTTIKKK